MAAMELSPEPNPKPRIAKSFMVPLIVGTYTKFSATTSLTARFHVMCSL